MTTIAVAAGPADEDDGSVLDRVPCRCGRLAVLVLTHEEDSVTCVVRCACGVFAPRDAKETKA